MSRAIPDGPNLGQLNEALASYQKARELVGPLAAQRGDFESLDCLIWLHYKCGELEFRGVGSQAGVDSLKRGIATAETLVARFDDVRSHDLVRNGYQRLANAQMRLGSTTAALESAKLAAAAADQAMKHERTPEAIFSLSKSRLLLGDILWLKGDLQSAARDYEEAIQWLEQGRATGRPEALQELAEAYRRAGDLQGNPAFFHFGETKRAEASFRKALEISEQLAGRDPKDAQAQAQLGNVMRHLASVLRDSDPEESIRLYRRAEAILEPLLLASPGDFKNRRDLANTSLGLSFPYRATKRYQESLAELDKALRGSPGYAPAVLQTAYCGRGHVRCVGGNERASLADGTACGRARLCEPRPDDGA